MNLTEMFKLDKDTIHFDKVWVFKNTFLEQHSKMLKIL